MADTVRYERRPRTGARGTYVILTRRDGECVGTCYTASGSILWGPRYVQPVEEFKHITSGLWIDPATCLPEGF